MITEKEIYNQNVADLSWVILKYSEIIIENGIKPDQVPGVRYCCKILNQVNEKFRKLEEKE